MVSAWFGLLGALVGAAAVLGAVWLANWQQSRAADADARERAYVDMLATSMALAGRVRALLTTLKVRSGVSEGLAVTFGQRGEMDAMALHEWVAADFQPLMDAWTRIWTIGSPAGIDAANKLLDCCAEVMSVLDYAAPPSLLGRLRETVVGIKTDQLLETYSEKLSQLARARRDLAELVRAETGRPAAALFATDE